MLHLSIRGANKGNFSHDHSPQVRDVIRESRECDKQAYTPKQNINGLALTEWKLYNFKSETWIHNFTVLLSAPSQHLGTQITLSNPNGQMANVTLKPAITSWFCQGFVVEYFNIHIQACLWNPRTILKVVSNHGVYLLNKYSCLNKWFMYFATRTYQQHPYCIYTVLTCLAFYWQFPNS